MPESLAFFQDIDIFSAQDGLVLLEHPFVRVAYLILRIFMGSIGLFFLAFIIFALLRTSYLRFGIAESLNEVVRAKPYGMKKQTRQWKKITKRLESNNEGELKLAVLEADRMFEEVLRRLEIPGETTEERLEQVPKGMFSNIEEIKETRQVRNNIVYDPNYHITREQATQAVNVYQRIFQSLDLI